MSKEIEQDKSSIDSTEEGNTEEIQQSSVEDEDLHPIWRCN